MAEYLIQDTSLTAIADAIREKTGSTDTIAVSDFPTAIAGISTGGSVIHRKVVATSADEIIITDLPEINGFVLYRKDYVEGMVGEATDDEITYILGCVYNSSYNRIVSWTRKKDATIVYLTAGVRDGTFEIESTGSFRTDVTYTFLGWYEETTA